MPFARRNAAAQKDRERRAFVTDREQKVYDALHALDIPFTVMQHEAVHTMDDCTALVAEPDVVYCKNLFLCNRQKTRFYLLLVLPDKVFHTASVSGQLGVSRLSFAPEELLPDYLGLCAGAVSPMGLLNDPQGRVRLLVDSDLPRSKRVAFHPCVNTATLILSTQDFLNVYLPHTDHIPTMVSLPAEESFSNEVS